MDLTKSLSELTERQAEILALELTKVREATELIDLYNKTCKI